MVDELITVLRIKQKSCGLSFGQAPCTATGVQCYNTTATCKDRNNLMPTTTDLWLTSERQNMPVIKNNNIPIYTIPNLLNANITPAKLNINNGNTNLKALGARETLSVDCRDHPHNENGVDKYKAVRVTTTDKNGTFWTKWLTRNKYYQNTELELYIGKIGDDISGMEKRLYVIEKISYNGIGVSITAKDILKLADDDKAIYPALTTGRLIQSVAVGSSTIEVTGASQYAQPSGFIAIGDENIMYTTASVTGENITFGGLTRAMHGTTAAGHNINAVVQRVEVAESAIAYDVAKTFLDASGVPATYYDVVEWAANNQELLLFPISYVIRKPVGVNQLLGELCRDTGCLMYWDATKQKIQLRYIQPIAEPTAINQDDDIIHGSVSSKVADDRRINEIWLYFDQGNNAKPMTDAGNADLVVYVDTDAKTAEEYGDRRISTIHSRFINNEAHAIDTAERLLLRYRDAPVIYDITVKTKKTLGVGDFVDLTHWQFVAADGTQDSKRCQIVSLERMTNGRIELELESFEAFAGSFNVYMQDDASDYIAGTIVNSYYADDDDLLSDGKKGAIYG